MSPNAASLAEISASKIAPVVVAKAEAEAADSAVVAIVAHVHRLMLYAQHAVFRHRFHLNQIQTNQFIAEIALKRIARFNDKRVFR